MCAALNENCSKFIFVGEGLSCEHLSIWACKREDYGGIRRVEKTKKRIKWRRRKSTQQRMVNKNQPREIQVKNTHTEEEEKMFAITGESTTCCKTNFINIKIGNGVRKSMISSVQELLYV